MHLRPMPGTQTPGYANFEKHKLAILDGIPENSSTFAASTLPFARPIMVYALYPLAAK
jgi:hypothetical protein